MTTKAEGKAEPGQESTDQEQKPQLVQKPAANKPGPKPKANQEQVDSLSKRVDAVEEQIDNIQLSEPQVSEPSDLGEGYLSLEAFKAFAEEVESHFNSKSPDVQPGDESPESEDDHESITDRLNRLESALGKMAHHMGGSIPRICNEFNIPVWTPGRRDMQKYKD